MNQPAPLTQLTPALLGSNRLRLGLLRITLGRLRLLLGLLDSLGLATHQLLLPVLLSTGLLDHSLLRGGSLTERGRGTLMWQTKDTAYSLTHQQRTSSHEAQPRPASPESLASAPSSSACSSSSPAGPPASSDGSAPSSSPVPPQR
jgi:hypothetical protein